LSRPRGRLHTSGLAGYAVRRGECRRDIRRAHLRVAARRDLRLLLRVDGLRFAGEITIAEAARKEKVSEQSIGRWKAEFLEAGKAALIAGRTGPSSREQQLEVEVTELTQALGEAAVEIRVWKRSAEGRLGPSRTSK
jgi:transposase